MDTLETNVILRYKRLCDCWLCPDCSCENMMTDTICSVCGAYRRPDSPVLLAKEPEPVAPLPETFGRSARSGTYVPGPHVPSRSPAGVRGTPPITGRVPASVPEESSGSGAGLVVALILIVIAVIAISVAILLYQ